MFQRVVGLARMKKAQREASLRALLPGVFGYLSSVAAVAGGTNLDDVLALLPSLSKDWEVISRVPFEERIAGKRHAS